MTTIMTSLSQIINIYNIGGFKIQHLQLESTWKDIETNGLYLKQQDKMNMSKKFEHYIRTVKKGCWQFQHPNLQKNLHWLILETIYNAIYLLNCFPHKDRIHTMLCLREIITGSHIDYQKLCKLEYGFYVQVHEEHNHSLLQEK